MGVWHNRPIRYLILCGVLLITMIAVGTAIMVVNFRNRALLESERELKNTALILAEQIDRSFQALDLVQRSVVEKVQSLDAASRQDYQRQMSGQGVHLMLKDKTSGLIHVDSIALIDRDGKLLNFSREWPIPTANVADQDYFNAFASDEELTSYMSLPARSRVTDTWTVYLARKLVTPKGELLGLVLGAIELSYFEKIFGNIVLGEGGSITLYRSDGVVLARYPRNESVIGKSYPAAINALKDGNSGTIRFIGQMGGKDRLLAAHRLKHYPSHVSVALDTDVALVGWERETKLLLAAGGLAALTIAIMFFLIVRQLSEGHKVSTQSLALKTQQLDTAINNMAQGLLMFDSANRIVVCNRRYIEMYGLSPEVVKPGCTLGDLLSHRKETGSFPGDVDEFLSTILRNLTQGVAREVIKETVDKLIVRIVIQPMVAGGWVATHEDVTEQRKLEQERDRDRKFLNQIINNVPATIVVRDASTRKYVLINKAGEEYFGIPRDQIIGKTAHDVWPQASADVIDGHDDQLLKSNGYLLFNEYALPSFGKSSRFVTSKKLIIRNGNGEPQYLLGVVEDVTERKRSEERITHLAHYDGLTDLPNRVFFRERLEQALKQVHRGECVAVLYLDLDHFKTFNDTLGHPIGDELLKVVAARFRACLGETDVAARLVGDEFAIIQTAISGPTDVIDLITQIHKAIKEPCEIGGHQLLTDVSIGIAIAPDNGTDPDQLLKNADLAMCGAKTDGRGSYRFFEPGMDARIKARHALEFDLREAIRNGGFDLYYQPFLSLRDNTITGCEALLRWRHSERGMISPTEFIPIAEGTGLITILGEWVLRTACAQAVTWPNNINVAVNVSPVQFKNGNFVQMVINALGASRLPARRLELEITEAVLIHDDEAALAMLHQLRGLGVRIALDDFGTGYSSLSYLQRLPFDKIKIDRSFINDVAESEGSRSIVKAVVSIATTRNITTTAEGVETEQQMKLLRRLGCTEMQGYLFSPAIPAAKIRELLLSRCEAAAFVA
jgi:diguanylate cyclase (GGDEF)-like protein/PAS domain S-box-containing protein